MNAPVRYLLLVLLAAGAIATAGDQAAPPTPAEPPAAEEPSPPPATPTPDPEELLEEFVPSEEVPADTAVAFPVDI